MDSTSDLALSTDDEPLAPAPSSAERHWACRVAALGDARYALHLSGSLHVSWSGRLAAGLAARNINVVHATARRAANQWTAEIVFDVLAPGVEPSAIDFIALMRERPDAPWRAHRPVLASYAIAATSRDVEVAIRARDALGFLDRILLVFAAFGLFPHEMRVETRGTHVHDVFRLQTADGRSPPARAVAALRERLAALVAR